MGILKTPTLSPQWLREVCTNLYISPFPDDFMTSILSIMLIVRAFQAYSGVLQGRSDFPEGYQVSALLIIITKEIATALTVASEIPQVMAQ
jgi:hypothetical protein